jgi:hypothetical protein
VVLYIQFGAYYEFYGESGRWLKRSSRPVELCQGYFKVNVIMRIIAFLEIKPRAELICQLSWIRNTTDQSVVKVALSI